MKAVVFAAGIGSRLKPFTDSHPKALAPLGGEPVLGRVLRKIAAAGASGIIVNVHHFPEQIRAYLATADLGVPVEISDESDLLLDTAGGLAKIYRQSAMPDGMAPGETLLLHNADIWTDFPLGELIGQHIASGADATLLADPGRASSRAFLFDMGGRLRGWRNTAKGIVRPEGLDMSALAPAAFGGVHVISGATLARVSDYVGPELHPAGITDFYIDSCSGLDIRRYTPAAPYRWHDIGTTEKLAAAEAEFEKTN